MTNQGSSSLDDLVDFLGHSVQRGEYEVVSELFRSVGKNAEDYLRENPEKIRIKKNHFAYLDCSCLGLTALPVNIGRLELLETLDVGDNELTFLPESIGRLPSLKELYVDFNELTSLPEGIGRLGLLEILYVNRNRLDKKAIELCSQLRSKGVSVYRF